MLKKISLWFYFVFLLFPLISQEIPVGEQPSISAKSQIDWNTQLIHSVISLDVKKKGLELPTGRNAALQMLEMETPALLKDTFFSIIVDSSERLGNSVTRGQISLGELNRIIDQGKKTPPYFSPDLLHVSMSHTISLAQIGSLFVQHKTTYVGKIPLETTPTRVYTGILIDARGSVPIHGEYTNAPLVPCLFPRIWSMEMDLLYEKNMVNPTIALKKGIVFYSSSLDESQYRDQIGTDPLRISAREIYGENRTDPVISGTDYLKIVTLPENRKLLQEGKIVIICNPNELNPKNLGPVKDDGYYFAWHDIDQILKKKKATSIDFSSSWEGLKLTIYDIRFVADSAQILPDEQKRLDVIAEALKLAGSNAHFVVEGHTASIGKPSGEWTLSVQRAQKIAQELEKRGITAERIDFTGFGGKRAIASNDTDEGRALNRRVEITIHLD